MLNRIIGFSLEHRAIVLLARRCAGGFGLMSLASLPIDAFPDTSPVMVQVNTMVPALGPEEIEVQITYPIEQVISGLPGLTEVRSISKFGLSQVNAIFQDGFDILRARQLVSERLTVAELPEQAGMHKPELGADRQRPGRSLSLPAQERPLRPDRAAHDPALAGADPTAHACPAWPK